MASSGMIQVLGSPELPNEFLKNCIYTLYDAKIFTVGFTSNVFILGDTVEISAYKRG